LFHISEETDLSGSKGKRGIKKGPGSKARRQQNKKKRQADKKSNAIAAEAARKN